MSAQSWQERVLATARKVDARRARLETAERKRRIAARQRQLERAAKLRKRSIS